MNEMIDYHTQSILKSFCNEQEPTFTIRINNRDYKVTETEAKLISHKIFDLKQKNGFLDIFETTISRDEMPGFEEMAEETFLNLIHESFLILIHHIRSVIHNDSNSETSPNASIHQNIDLPMKACMKKLTEKLETTAFDIKVPGYQNSISGINEESAIGVLNMIGNARSIEYVALNMDKFISSNRVKEIVPCRLESVLGSERLRVKDHGALLDCLIGYIKHRKEMRRMSGIENDEERILHRLPSYVSIGDIGRVERNKLADFYIETLLKDKDSNSDLQIGTRVMQQMVDLLKGPVIYEPLYMVNLTEKYKNEIKISSTELDPYSGGNLKNVLDINTLDYFLTIDSKDSYIEFEFPVDVEISRYDARSYGGGSWDPCSWALEVFTDKWVPIDTRTDCSAFKNSCKEIRSFEIRTKGTFGKKVRIRTTGVNSDGESYYLRFAGIVFYGLPLLKK